MGFFVSVFKIIHFVVTFELHYALFFWCSISGSHHSGSPLARGARYCMSADSSKVYTIPQTSSSGPEPGPGDSSEACGQTRPQPGCKLPVGMKTTDDDDDDAQRTEGPPNISECGWVWVREKAREIMLENNTKYALIPQEHKSKCTLLQIHKVHIKFSTSYHAKPDGTLFNHAYWPPKRCFSQCRTVSSYTYCGTWARLIPGQVPPTPAHPVCINWPWLKPTATK